MTLRLTPDHLQQIQAHAEGTYPDECCGLLLGRGVPDEPDMRAIVEVWQTQNAWSDEVARELSGSVHDDLPLSKSRRYWIDPKEMLVGQRYARDRHLTIIGIYHSHIDHPAVPSECDRVLAWSDYSYLIVSVRQGCAQNLLSWRLDPSHQFQPETILNSH
ncbi:M67 family metallopeptidase [Oscillatoria sp. FACHB-1407]|uniref:Mov34/MPN/PAD-1 family protein n=1 Tax=Oscillatoria sp. FACHB-1407 TaxID=2692847 RepID=UPI0016849114|nr:Mov34/MPN/PAD-1 family protein [Oscillatoria sp. FACHB-1407]MBD2462431.1 M67 family metallopeptidase [Oscillatoria sp. FACHB-1407]